MENKDLFQIASDLDAAHTFLSEDYAALCFVYDGVEGDGYQHEDTFEDWKAIYFGHRIPRYLSMLNLIRRDMERNLEEAGSAVQRLYQLRNEEVAIHEE